MMKRLIIPLLLLASTAYAGDKLRLERLDVQKWPTVRMYLTYTDSDGRVVTGRGKENFRLALDSAEQGNATETKAFSVTQEPVNIVIIVQISGAMQEVLEEAKKG